MPSKKKTKKKNKDVDVGGRPTLIDNEEIIGRLFKAVKLGMPYSACCDYAGISEATLYNWKQHGEQARINKDNGEELEGMSLLYFQFLEKLKKAESLSQLKLLSEIHSDTSWQAKAWILERRFPSEYGRVDRMEVTGKDGQPFKTLNVNLEKELTMEEAEKLDSGTLLALLE